MHHGLAAWSLLLMLGCGRQSGHLRPGIRPMSTRGDLGTIFRTEDEAAVAGCAWLWKHEPNAKRFEYCGVIYRDAEGIKAGLPATYELTNYCKLPRPPAGTERRAGYHNHRDTEWFSGEDRALADELARYLCTPSGRVLKMTMEGTVIVK